MQNSTKIELFTKIAQGISVPVLKKNTSLLQTPTQLLFTGLRPRSAFVRLADWLGSLARWHCPAWSCSSSTRRLAIYKTNDCRCSACVMKKARSQPANKQKQRKAKKNKQQQPCKWSASAGEQTNWRTKGATARLGRQDEIHFAAIAATSDVRSQAKLRADKMDEVHMELLPVLVQQSSIASEWQAVK